MSKHLRRATGEREIPVHDRLKDHVVSKLSVAVAKMDLEDGEARREVHVIVGDVDDRTIDTLLLRFINAEQLDGLVDAITVCRAAVFGPRPDEEPPS